VLDSARAAGSGDVSGLLSQIERALAALGALAPARPVVAADTIRH
jgi:hypothetical protein